MDFKAMHGYYENKKKVYTCCKNGALRITKIVSKFINPMKKREVLRVTMLLRYILRQFR